MSTTLTDSQFKILWDALKDPYYLLGKHFDELDEIKTMATNGLIEIHLRYTDSFPTVTRLLPDGVFYLCIETCFLDFRDWANLVSERVNSRRDLHPVTIEEMYLYRKLSSKLLEAGGYKDVEANRISDTDFMGFS
jgi:hypothetical protein